MRSLSLTLQVSGGGQTIGRAIIYYEESSSQQDLWKQYEKFKILLTMCLSYVIPCFVYICRFKLCNSELLGDENTLIEAVSRLGEADQTLGKIAKFWSNMGALLNLLKNQADLGKYKDFIMVSYELTFVHCKFIVTGLYPELQPSYLHPVVQNMHRLLCLCREALGHYVLGSSICLYIPSANYQLTDQLANWPTDLPSIRQSDRSLGLIFRTHAMKGFKFDVLAYLNHSQTFHILVKVFFLIWVHLNWNSSNFRFA